MLIYTSYYTKYFVYFACFYILEWLYLGLYEKVCEKGSFDIYII